MGIVFTSGGSSFETQKTLSGQALKAIFTLRKYPNNFTALWFTHIMDLFDKLITPVLNYGSEVWGFHQAKSIETTHMSFAKECVKLNRPHKTISFMANLAELITSLLGIFIL